MINESMRALGSERSEIRELFEYAKGRKALLGEENVFDFSLGNPSIPCPDEVTRAISELIAGEDPVSLHGYTSAQGDTSVREAIAKHINDEHGVAVTAENLYMTVGAAAALTCSISALVCPGEEVILLAPYFPEYRVFTERCGGIVREVKCDSRYFYPDVSAIETAITEKTAVIIINSPNNPTGAVYGKELLLKLADVLSRAEKKYAKSIYLIADEPYRDLAYDGVDVPFIPKLYRNTVVCYSYSKSLSLPGERIGFCLVNPEADSASDVYNAICGAGRAMGYVCAPSLLQKVLPKCLGKVSDMAIYNRNRQLLFTKLTEYGYEAVYPQGAFYLFVKAPGGDAKAFSQIAKLHELILVPSDSFGYGGYVRISYCVKTELINRSLPAFRRLAEEAGLIKR